MWIINSDLHLIGVLIAEYNLSNDRIRNSDQLKGCTPLSYLDSSDLSFYSKSYDSNTKIYPVRI